MKNHQHHSADPLRQICSLWHSVKIIKDDPYYLNVTDNLHLSEYWKLLCIVRSHSPLPKLTALGKGNCPSVLHEWEMKWKLSGQRRPQVNRSNKQLVLFRILITRCDAEMMFHRIKLSRFNKGRSEKISLRVITIKTWHSHCFRKRNPPPN